VLDVALFEWRALTAGSGPEPSPEAVDQAITSCS
jgi:hypothetical protein